MDLGIKTMEGVRCQGRKKVSGVRIEKGFRCQVSGVRFQVSGVRIKLRALAPCMNHELNSEPQNRRISNIECRRVVSLRSVFYKIERIHYSTFDVGRSTCPQCLEAGVRQI
jgi:hypothetical protein